MHRSALRSVSISGTEGSTIGTIPVATFTDANPNATASDFSATINWGDGTTTTGAVVAQNGGGFAVDGAHTYSDEGKYTVSTTIKDVGGSTASASGTASVADAALSAVSVGGQPQTLFQSVPDLFSTPPNSDFVDDVAGNQQMFDTFMLGNDSSVTSITFDVSNLTQFFPNWTSEPLTLAIYNIAPGGGPGTKLFSATFTPDADAHINFNLSFATALVTYDAHLALNPGTYLITYYNQDGLGAMDFVNGGSDQAFAEHLSTGTISPVNESLGFSLNGEVVTTGATISGTEGTAIADHGCDLHRRQSECDGERLHGDDRLGRRHQHQRHDRRAERRRLCGRRHAHLCRRRQVRDQHDHQGCGR